MAAKQARIKTIDPRFPFALQVTQHADGRVFFDIRDMVDGRVRQLIKTNGKNARALGQWILDNVEE